MFITADGSSRGLPAIAELLAIPNFTWQLVGDQSDRGPSMRL